MARTISTIQAQIKATVQADPVLGPLFTSTSATAVWLLWTWVIATCIWTLENLFDVFVALVKSILATQKPHTLQWYTTKATAFQYGVPLPADSDVYALVPPVDPTVLIIAGAAAYEQVNLIRLKVAKLVGGILVALSGPELTAFTAYIQRIKDAGVRVVCTTGNADTLQLAVTVFYDPLILKADGSRIDGSSATPVKDAVNAYLASVNNAFIANNTNGVLIYNDLIAALQAVEGVAIGEVVTAQAHYASTPYVTVNPQYVPDAGYLALDSGYFDANVSYEAYGI